MKKLYSRRNTVLLAIVIVALGSFISYWLENRDLSPKSFSIF